MSQVINEGGWAEKSATRPDTNNVLFGEYGNSGVGSKGPRAKFATALSSPVAIADILDDGYQSWVDAAYLS